MSSLNPAVEVLKTEVLSNNWYVLRKVTFRLQKRDGTWETQSREAYDRGNGATILPYNLTRRTVILTRQFRLPTFVNGNESGMLIETCAGLLDKENPSECITRELREETGFEIQNVQKVMEAYMSPGSVTEVLYFFVCEYTAAQRTAAGGGVEEEDIDGWIGTVESGDGCGGIGGGTGDLNLGTFAQEALQAFEGEGLVIDEEGAEGRRFGHCAMSPAGIRMVTAVVLSRRLTVSCADSAKRSSRRPMRFARPWSGEMSATEKPGPSSVTVSSQMLSR